MTISRDTADRGHLASNPNLLINGDLSVWQRATSGVDGYIADRWEMFNTTSCSRGVTTTAVIPGYPEVYQMYFSQSGSVSAPIAEYKMEADEAELLTGKQVTLSLWAINSTGATAFKAQLIRPQSVKNVFSPVTGIETKEIFGDSTTTGDPWVKYTVTFDAIPDASLGLGLRLYRATGAASTTNIALVKLEVGAVATPIIIRPYSVELALCQRYYCECLLNIRGPASGATQYFENPIAFPTPMFKTPTVGIISSAPVNCTESISVANKIGARHSITSSAAGDCRSLSGTAYADAEL